MRPVLFELGPLSVHAYRVMMAAAGLAAWLVVRHELQRRAGRGECGGALVLAAIVGGFVGARLYYAAEHLEAPLSGLLTGAGFTWYGGVLGGAAAVIVVAHRQGLTAGALLASAALALPLAYAVGRIDCQLAGDGTYGVASDLSWAMSYPDGEVPTSVRVHPTPVYEMLVSLLIFAGLWTLRDRLAAVRLFGLYLLLAGAERFLVEFLRRNDAVVLGLTQPQLFAAAFIVVGIALLVARPPRLERVLPAGGAR